MTMVLRVAAITIALAGLVDPAIARRRPVPLPVDVLMPRGSDPDHRRAAAVREGLTSRLHGRLTFDGPEAPQVLVAIGPAILPDSLDVPVFTIPLATTGAVSITGLRAPGALPGQVVPVVATLRAVGVAGQTTSLALERGGTVVETLEHVWTSNDEVLETRFAFVGAGPGVHRVRVTATTAGVEERVVADAAVAVGDRRLRVLTYEPRPSWPVAFVRRSLEADPLFNITGTARTTNRSATTTAGAPATLAGLQADRFDVILVGAPETLSDADSHALDAFVSRRGGALILMPDRAIPDSFRRRFGLPELQEVVLERPLTLQPPSAALRASELLLAPPVARGFEPLGLLRHGGRERAVVASVVRGAGRVILSGALDAWRYRADEDGAFDLFWRGLVADAAGAAPPRLAVTVEPSIARAGDEITVSAMVRPTEFQTDSGSATEIHAVTAALLSSDGQQDLIRLWPGGSPGRFTARIQAPRAGEYSVSVSGPGATADVPLLVTQDAVHVTADLSAAAAFAAQATGGAVVADAEELAARISAIEAAGVEVTYPMRSPWWILPFTGLLCAEWALRRRGGLR